MTPGTRRAGVIPAITRRGRRRMPAKSIPGMANYPSDGVGYPSAAPVVAEPERQPLAAAAGRSVSARDSRSDPLVRRRRARRREGHRHPGGRAAQPRDGLEDVRPVPAGRHRRRRRQIRADRADLAGDGQLRRRLRDGRRAGQHAVLRRGHRGKQEQGRALPAHHHRAVRRHRPADRPRAGPVAARSPGRAGHVVRVAHRAGGGADRQLRRRHRQLPVRGCSTRARWE